MKNGNPLQVTISISILLLAIAGSYYLVTVLPARQKYNQHILCEGEASIKARESLGKKVSMASGYHYDTYKKAYDKGMYLKEDHENYYQICLKRYGLD